MAEQPIGGQSSASVLAALGVSGPMSRAELARRLSMSPATVTQLTKQLLATGLVRELTSVPSGGGRPATLLGLAGEGGGALGAKLSADKVTVVRLGLDGAVRSVAEHPYDAARPDALDSVARLLRTAVDDAPGSLLGVGIGLPGSVGDRGVGTVDSPTLGWRDVHVGQFLRRELGVPVLVDNDVNTLAVAERLLGAARDYESPMILTIGRGVGCAVVVEGTLLRGTHGGAGEVGHVPVADGPVCECGGSGCLEAVIGEAALVARARFEGAIGRRSGKAALDTAADRGGAAARRVFADAGALLGRTVAGVVHVVDPDALVVLGEGTSAWQHWEPTFTESLRRHLMPSRRGLPVRVETWTDEKWAVGAASLVLFSPFDATGAGGDQGRAVRDRLHHSLAAEAAR
jgi:predicted NBD/HSP70 family sugar kinase